VSPTVINFGKVTITHLTPPQTVTLTNTGSATAKFKAIKIEGANGGEYEISTNTCGQTLDIGESCSFEVAFDPADGGEQLAEVYIEDNATGSPQTVLLEGKGVR
jgi:hypothetical protein